MQDRVPAADRDFLASRQVAGRASGALLVERPEDGVVVLTMNRPERRNTLSEEMLAALQAAVDALSTDNSVRAVVLTATGAAFSPGHDLRELTEHRDDADGGRAYYEKIMGSCAQMMQSIVASPKPFIAAVQATAVAAGCQLVATCDLAVAADDATFGTTGINNGLFCSTPMVALSRNTGRKKAMELLMLGELMTAAEAERQGLVNRVVPRAEVAPAALDLARRIAEKSPAAIAIGKQAFYVQAEEPLAEAYARTAAVIVENMMFADAAEGIDAFLGKRKPEWQGR